METSNLIDCKIAYVSWDIKRLELEKLLLYERLTLINTIIQEKKENEK
jgi:hypothetical protein